MRFFSCLLCGRPIAPLARHCAMPKYFAQCPFVCLMDDASLPQWRRVYCCHLFILLLKSSFFGMCSSFLSCMKWNLVWVIYAWQVSKRSIGILLVAGPFLFLFFFNYHETVFRRILFVKWLGVSCCLNSLIYGTVFSTFISPFCEEVLGYIKMNRICHWIGNSFVVFTWTI